jgi:hypothetical protein
MGAYRRAADALKGLEGRLADDPHLQGPEGRDFLTPLARLMRQYNTQLDETVGASGKWSRHPTPGNLPLSPQVSFDDPAGGSDTTAEFNFTWIYRFYDAVLWAIDEDRPPPSEPAPESALEPAPEWAFATLEQAVLGGRGNPRQGSRDAGSESERTHRARRRARFESRRSAALLAGIPDGHLIQDDEKSRRERTDAAVASVASSHLSTKHQGPLPDFVMQAFVDAHLTMHQVEAHLSAPLERRLERVTTDEATIEKLLERSIALNTFVWAAARIAPWMFAEDDTERVHINRNYERAWSNTMPMRTMWIGAQVSLLALHRRAYALSLLGDKTGAYKDFHKLRRHLRDTVRRVRDASIHVEGAIEFLESLDALADHHIGELYRRDRDPVSALTHFHRAYDRLERLKCEQGGLVVVNSRWFVQLQMSLGKACYALGRHKASLGWYLRTWRSLLELIAADTNGKVNPDAIDQALEWLAPIVDEAEIRKSDLVAHLKPVVDQLVSFRVHPFFEGLASDVVLRLGHLLFVLNLGKHRSEEPAHSPIDLEAAAEDGTLALICVRRAWQLDRGHTLALADLLKLEFRATRDDGQAPPELTKALERRRAVTMQWAGGATTVERMCRAIEYVLMEQLRQAREHENAIGKMPDERAIVARELLHSLLTHTDSIEARKSQVHGYLTRPPSRTELPHHVDAAAMEFVCLRRYSSPSPILPRPHAFRADGGGYFVRIHPTGGTGRAFGIAVDPGPSYVECLYRCGFAISDVDMIVATHDHVDHTASLEPLLALRHERGQLGHASDHSLIVLGNRSVVDRLQVVKAYGSLDIQCLDFEDEALKKLNSKLTRRVNELSPKGSKRTSVKLTPLQSLLPKTKGHLDLSENPSCGILLSVGGAAKGAPQRSLAITSDLPGIPPDLSWPAEWLEALRADVLVCHLSTVPMAELRKLADFGRPMSEQLAKDIEWINGVWGRNDVRRGRLAYAYWLGEADAPQLQPVGDADGLSAWSVPTTHPYLGGLLELAAAFDRATDAGRGDRLFVVGELSEELGSFRGKIAAQLNRSVFDSPRESAPRSQALTGDIGLRVVMPASTEPTVLGGAVRVLCSTCDLDNDLAPVERFHEPNAIFEVCVKGENEGVFYNCAEHQPTAPGDSIFLERLERYDVFGR